MREAELQVKLTRWVKENWSRDSAGFEVKITKGAMISFSEFKDHQLIALKKSAHTGLTHKISDMSAGYKPFDFFVLRNALAYWIVGFNDGADVYMIDGGLVWGLMVKESGERRRGSMKLEWARDMGERVEV